MERIWTHSWGAENEMDKDIEEIYKEEKGFITFLQMGTKERDAEVVLHCMEDPSSVLR